VTFWRIWCAVALTLPLVLFLLGNGSEAKVRRDWKLLLAVEQRRRRRRRQRSFRNGGPGTEGSGGSSPSDAPSYRGSTFGALPASESVQSPRAAQRQAATPYPALWRP
jgi:hypothetical protein